MKVTESGKLKHRQLQKKAIRKRYLRNRESMRKRAAPPKMTETDITNTNQQTEGLLERILTRDNLNCAYKQVKRNKGAGGIDGMQVDELLPYLREHRENFFNPSGTENIRPKPVRRVEIPKENGKTRKLGIPTVVDRLIQQAIAKF